MEGIGGSFSAKGAKGWWFFWGGGFFFAKVGIASAERGVAMMVKHWECRVGFDCESPANELRANGCKHDESCWGLVLC